MSNVHIFTAPYQPAVRFRIDSITHKPHWIISKARTPIFTDCCLSWRWAKYCRVQVFYDDIRRYCKPGHGCKA